MSNFFAMLCPKCGQSSEYPSEAFGQWTQCPHCRAQVVAKPATAPPNPTIPFDHPPEFAKRGPDTKHCRECNLVILKTAATCFHCGARQAPRKLMAPIIAGIAFLILVVGGILLVAQRNSGSSAKGLRTLHATFQFAGDRLSIRNDDPFAWRAAELYLNGTPPFTFHYGLGNLEPGSSQIIPLSSFISEGAPFPAGGTRITNIWLGGSGYDFNVYQF